MSDKIFKFISAIGIGDLFIYKSQINYAFENNQYKKFIFLPLNFIEKITKYRYNEYYNNFYNPLFKIIFNDLMPDSVELQETFLDKKEFGELQTPLKLLKHQLFPTNKNFNNLNLYLDKLPKIDGKYIIINTKYRLINVNSIIKNIENIFNLLLETNLPIYILGEQNINMAEEYNNQSIKGLYGSFYNFIPKFILQKVNDLSFDKIDTSPNSLTRFLNDLNIVKNAYCSVSFGGGGAFCYSLYLNKNPLGMIDNTNLFKEYNKLFSIWKENNCFLSFSNIDEFKQQLKKLF